MFMHQVFWDGSNHYAYSSILGENILVTGQVIDGCPDLEHLHKFDETLDEIYTPIMMGLLGNTGEDNVDNLKEKLVWAAMFG